jgi:dipeptidyl aminopeptidase/acylaminoacyl peptidase
MNRLTFLFLGALAAAQTPTLEQSLSLRTVASPVISPDGRFIAYLVNETDWEDNSFKTQIWVYDAASGERYQLTSSRKGSASPRWSPDGKRLAFLSARDARTQIHLISPAGGEAIQATDFDADVQSFDWSPDGRRFALLSPGPRDKAKKEREDKFGDFEIVNADYQNVRLWVCDVPAGGAKAKPEPVSPAEVSVTDFAWSPDSGSLALTAATDPDLSHQATADLYLLRLSDKGFRKLVSTPGPERNPAFSPDGASIAFQTANGEEGSYYRNSRIAVVPASGGAPRIVSEAFDENPNLIGWGPDGIYFGGFQRTAMHVFRLHPATGAVTKLTAPADGIFAGASFTRDYTRMAFTCAAPNRMAEVCQSPVNGFSARPVTDMGGQLKDFRLARREVVEWKSKDGTLIEGVLIKPANFDPAAKYPLLVVIHGGPTGIDLPSLAPDRIYPIERFAAKGAVILRPNYRGSAGYGEKFRSLNVRNLGLGDHDDVVSGVDFLIGKGYIDPERVGAMGWSQGGYISAFLATYSNRFKAASVGAGISNWMTYYVNTDIHPFTRQYLKATPWEDPEIYRKTSPITYINQARTPTLIQHGELDRRVPIPNAYELYQGLQDRNVPAKLIVYKGFGHGINKPKQARAVLEHNYDWFSQWIWGEKPAKIAE